MRFYLHDLPYKFLNHTSGPISRLGQYSKVDVVPNDYIAIVGDIVMPLDLDHGYTITPGVGDNLISRHITCFIRTKIDFISFGYPGFGSLGACLSAVSEYGFVSESSFWPELAEPKVTLLFFYEGNDLISNLHEIEQRGFDITRPPIDDAKNEIGILMQSEAGKLDEPLSWLDHSVGWNLFSGLYDNYSNRFQTTEPEIHSTNFEHSEIRTFDG